MGKRELLKVGDINKREVRGVGYGVEVVFESFTLSIIRVISLLFSSYL